MISIETLKTSNYILSTLVGIHIFLEFYHYLSEYLKNRRDRKMLEHIDEHLDNMVCKCNQHCTKMKDSNKEN
jgi:hypothetical protein